MINFEDRSIRQFVGFEGGLLIVIKQDHLNPGKWQISIYKNTMIESSRDLILRKNKISGLLQAKERASILLRDILANKNKTDGKK